MEGDFIKISKALLPLSWLYGLGVRLRNTMFDIGILKSRAYSIPVISVGNITVGGTGKTPHVEYLVRLLKSRLRVAVLSRGYKRKSKGFVLADSHSTIADIGDEPYQMMQKFPDITIAVDNDRRHGIERLQELDSKLDVILLDDAFQHRYVKPGINILLVDYHRLIIYDKLLPAGRLREPLNGKNRADVVIVTKCPKDLKPMEYRVIMRAMSLYPYQKLFFSTIEYGEARPVFRDVCAGLSPQLSEQNVLLLTGIASPEQMQHDLSPRCKSLAPLTFADHHTFSAKDVRLINESFASLPAPRCIITTEKDATRLQATSELSDEARRHLYVVPIEVCFLQNQTDSFNSYITDYIHKNSRNSILAKQKDGKQPPTADQEQPPKTIRFR